MTGRQRHILASFLASALMAGIGFERTTYHAAVRSMQAAQNVELTNLDMPRVDAIFAFAHQQILGVSWSAADTAGWAICLFVLTLWGLRARSSMTALGILAAYAAMGNPVAAQVGYGLMSLAGVNPGALTAPIVIMPFSWLSALADSADGLIDWDFTGVAVSAAYLLKEAMRAFVLGAAAWLIWDIWGSSLRTVGGKGWPRAC